MSAAFAKSLSKGASKEFLEKITKQAAEGAAKATAEKAAKEAAQKAAKEAIEKAAKETAEKVTKEGAEKATKEGAEKVTKEAGKQTAASVAKKAAIAAAVIGVGGYLAGTALAEYNRKNGRKFKIKSIKDSSSPLDTSYKAIIIFDEPEKITTTDQVSFTETDSIPSLDNTGQRTITKIISSTQIEVSCDEKITTAGTKGSMTLYTTYESQLAQQVKGAGETVGGAAGALGAGVGAAAGGVAGGAGAAAGGLFGGIFKGLGLSGNNLIIAIIICFVCSICSSIAAGVAMQLT